MFTPVVARYPGSVAGLPREMATLPQLLRAAGYRAHMVGKWHLGHAQPSQTPVGRGFESHTGSYMYGVDIIICINRYLMIIIIKT